MSRVGLRAVACAGENVAVAASWELYARIAGDSVGDLVEFFVEAGLVASATSRGSGAMALVARADCARSAVSRLMVRR